MEIFLLTTQKPRLRTVISLFFVVLYFKALKDPDSFRIQLNMKFKLPELKCYELKFPVLDIATPQHISLVGGATGTHKDVSKSEWPVSRWGGMRWYEPMEPRFVHLHDKLTFRSVGLGIVIYLARCKESSDVNQQSLKRNTSHEHKQTFPITE